MGKKSKRFLPLPARRAGQWLVYALFRTLEGVLWLLPIALVWQLGRLLGLAVWLVSGRYRRLALHNLRIAFGREKDEAWLRRTARRHFGALGGNLLCGFKLPMMSQEQVMKRVSIKGMDRCDAAIEAGRPVVFLVCHLSCWELLTQLPRIFAFNENPATIYQPLSNPYMDALVRRRRKKLGYQIFNRTDGFTGPMKHLRARGGMGILVDQHAGDQGIWCPFFGRLASTSPMATLMAQRAQGVMMPVAIYDDGPGRWRMEGYPVVDATEGKPSLEVLTARMNLAVEEVIRAQPHNWFWVHNRWKTPRPRFLLSGYKRGIALPPGFEAAQLQRFELLVRSPNWLGDACMAMPAVRAMKAGRPDLRLTVFGPEKLRELWEAVPEVDAYIGKEPGDGLLAAARRIRASGVRFDAGVLLTNSTRSTLEFRLAGLPRLVGFRGSLRSRLLHQLIKEPRVSGPPWHHTRRYLEIARQIGAPVGAWDEPAPANVPPPGGPVRIGICAGAEYGPAKRWPLEKFAEVIRLCAARHPQAEWVFFGAPGEAAMGEQLSSLVGGVRHQDLVGKTRLGELIRELRTCRLLLTNDTGTMHLAAALGVPTVSLFGSTEPVLTGPVGARHTVIRHHVPCSPCFRRECPFGHYDCMRLIGPERVAQAVLAGLDA
jgi:heptosyltransferase II